MRQAHVAGLQDLQSGETAKCSSLPVRERARDLGGLDPPGGTGLEEAEPSQITYVSWSVLRCGEPMPAEWVATYIAYEMEAAGPTPSGEGAAS